MWSFSTLQRPTQEEKERRRKYKEDKIRHANTLLPKSKVGRAKTFRERNNNEIEDTYGVMHEQNGPTSLPVSASMVEVLRHRAKSASRVDYYDTNKRSNKNKSSANATGFVSRLRFLDQHHHHDQPQKLRWQDREPSSGYSSGGRPADQEPGTSDDNIYGVKFASMPSEVFMTSTSTMPRKR